MLKVGTVRSPKTLVVMKTRFKILIPIASILLLCSCGQSSCIKKRILSTDKHWFNPYDSLDVVVFKSNYGNFDTLIVTTGKNDNWFTDCNRFELGPFQFETVSMSIKSNNKHGSSYDGEISITLTSQFFTWDGRPKGDTDCQKIIRVYNTEARFFDNSPQLISQTISNPYLKKQISSFYFDKNCNYFDKFYGNINSFNWNRKLGLLRYTTVDGEIYDLFEE